MRGSRADLPVGIELPDGSAINVGEWDGINVELGSFVSGIDPAPMFAGLPDDRCQCPHWGYVIKGELRFRFADHEEVFRAGDAYQVGPGHLPLIADGTEYVEFSPSGPYAETMAVLERNMAAAPV